MTEYPNRLREIRIDRGLSQQDLADRLGCSKMQISGLETGKPQLTVEWMRKIGRALDIAPAELLLPEDNPDHLSDEERELLAQLRSAPATVLEQARSVVSAVISPFRGSPSRLAA